MGESIISHLFKEIKVQNWL